MQRAASRLDGFLDGAELSSERLASAPLTARQILRLERAGVVGDACAHQALLLRVARMIRSLADVAGGDTHLSLPGEPPNRSLVRVLDGDQILVIGDTSIGDAYGERVEDLTQHEIAAWLGDIEGGQLTVTPRGATWGGAVGAGQVLAQAGSLVDGIRRTGTVFAVAPESRAAVESFRAMSSGGQMLGVLRNSNGTIEHIVRWQPAGGAALRSAASLSGMMFTIAVVAGQTRLFRTQQRIAAALDDLVDGDRERRQAHLTVAEDGLRQHMQLRREGLSSAAVDDLLPDIVRLQEQLDQCEQEVQRRWRQLSQLPPSARERERQLASLAPELIVAINMYSRASFAVVVTQHLRGQRYAEAGDPAASRTLELADAAAATRWKRVTALSHELENLLTTLGNNPGSGFFAGAAREKVRGLAQEAQRDVAVLRNRPLRLAQRDLSRRVVDSALIH